MATGPSPTFLDNEISENDLNKLHEVLYSIRVKYEALGMQIGVKRSDIKCIEADNTNRDSGKRLLEVLDLRLKKSPALTWGDIDKALRSKSVDKPRLANSIRETCSVEPEERPSSFQPTAESSSSSSSSSSDESSSECGEVLTNLSDTENKRLRKCFKRFFGRLCCKIKNPADVASDLQAKGLIKYSVMKELLMSPESDQVKTIKLVENIEKQIKQRPSRLFKFVELCLQIEVLQELGTEMKIATGKICPEITSMYFDKTITTLSPPSQEPTPRRGVDEVSTVSMDEASDTLAASIRQLEMTPALAIFKKYLQSVYAARELAPGDKYLPTLESPYINLAMISRDTRNKEERDEFTRQTLHGGVDQILKRKTPINIEDLLIPTKTESETNVSEAVSMTYPEHGTRSQQASHKVHHQVKEKEKKPVKFVLVEGPPGVGKSTFAWEYCRRWEEIESLQQYLIILLLKLREKWVLNATSLVDLFRYEYDPELSKSIARELSDPEVQSKILLVLDGFDEVSHSFHEDSVVKKILRRELLPACTIILTTRPSAKAALKSICQPRVDKHVEILGFTEEERVSYITEVFSKYPELQATFLKYMFPVPHIKSMMYIPLNCAIIAAVYHESQENSQLTIPRTITQLYKTLTHSLLVRHLKATNKESESSCMLPEDLEKEDMEFKALAKFAFDSYHNSKSRKVTFFKEDIPDGLVHFGMMNESSEMYMEKEVEKTFSFLHLSLQEYLAAWHLAHSFSTEFQVAYSQSVIESFSDTIQNHRGWTKEEEALIEMLKSRQVPTVEPAVFLAGITGWRSQSDNSNLWKIVTSDSCSTLFFPNDKTFRNALRLLYEAQNPALTSKCYSFDTRWKVTINARIQPYESYALSYCLAHFPDPVILHLKQCDVSCVETFVKGLDDHCNLSSSSKPIFSDLIVECLFLKNSDGIIFWLMKVKSLKNITNISISLPNVRSSHLLEFLKPMVTLKSLQIASLGASISSEWFSILKSMSDLETLYVHSNEQYCPQPTDHLCWPEEHMLKHIELNIKLHSSTASDALIHSVLKSVLRSNQVVTLTLPNISRETMADVHSILLHCPSLSSLTLERTILGYDGILFICRALKNNSTLVYLSIHDILQLPPNSASVDAKYPLPDKTTRTECLLELDDILKNNKSLNNLYIWRFDELVKEVSRYGI